MAGSGKMRSDKTAVFVTFEGIEGAGKSLQLSLLQEELRRRGITFTATQQPGGTPLGMELRRILLQRDGPQREPVAELLLYLADRYQHLAAIIEPALKRGVHVLCDRYHDATLAYQGHARGIGFETVDRLAEILQLRTPDLTLVFDLDVEVALERACARNLRENQQAQGRFEGEGLEFHRRVREGYRLLEKREPGRVVEVDGSGTPEQVFERVLRVVDGHGILGR